MTALPRFGSGPRLTGGHVGDLVHDYADDRLEPEVALAVDRHLLVCEMCRHEVAQERRLLACLRGHQPDPERQQRLVDGLLGLAAEHSPAFAQRAPQVSGPSVVTAGAPPQYQSARHPFAAALAAVVGCAGVAFVVSTSPTRTAPSPRPATPATVQLAPGSDAAVSRSAVLRARADAAASASRGEAQSLMSPFRAIP